MIINISMVQQQSFAVVNISVTFSRMLPKMWEICSWAPFFWTSRKSHICDRGPQMFPTFSCIEQKALSNDKYSLAFFSNRRYFIFETISFLQFRFSGIRNFCNICSFISLWGMKQFICDKAYFAKESSMLHELTLSIFVISNLSPISNLVFLGGFFWSLFIELL